ncbi:Embryonic polarity protein dorsal [Papilio machaon]|uniref:Embryonic polarity protein dorsal n=1 Tax=Papilio machaon TaxID=76193 RepID=A0A194QPD8_PAPMA|nr:Embryonic polarity protein dorsal [Papilio machaon]
MLLMLSCYDYKDLFTLWRYSTAQNNLRMSDDRRMRCQSVGTRRLENRTLVVGQDESDKGPVDLNISDILDAICIADPAFDAPSVSGMPRPAHAAPTMPAAPAAPAMPTMPAHGHPTALAPAAAPTVRIVEQPASKALRFRYECEGRSAGSIPGVNSTSERKTYPTIEISGCSGNAIVVVSCVTKDHPYKPHPHNLVGRERCERGVCTVKAELSGDSTLVSFSNLGIQCVKRKDVDAALRTREELRVDPFKTGFSHRAQPQSIDLNAVRLCFQVFVTGERGKVRLALAPVVSDIIYDKKAMSDLHIARVSHCTGPAGGRMTMILLCEKVTGQDTAVVFFEKENEEVVWEAAATNVHVHKQAAIAFDIPPYRDPAPRDNVKVYLQLKRVTDNARSNAVNFEYIAPPGTARKPLPDLAPYAALLRHKSDTNNNRPPPPPPLAHDTHALHHTDTTDNTDTDLDPVSSTSGDVDPQPDPQHNDHSAVNGDIADVVDSPEKSLDDLLDQVAELDEIYSENRTRLETAGTTRDADTDLEDFDDAGTYTSLQLAFRNPLPIAEPPAPEPDPPPYEDVHVQTYRGPIIEFTTLKRDTDDERAPPLPPKRVRKTADSLRASQTSVDSILRPGRRLPLAPPAPATPAARLTVAHSEPALPPAPKKRSFLSRLFRRKEKSPAPSVKSAAEGGRGKPAGRSVSSVSGQRPARFRSATSHHSLRDNASAGGLSYADSVTHISLHADPDEVSQSSLRRSGPLPPADGTILVAESVLALDASAFRKLRDDLDLTDAEHYALYMAVAPHATASEFDDTSCYYSPVDISSSSNLHN